MSRPTRTTAAGQAYLDLQNRALRPGVPPVCVLGYPIETVLAEKISTALALGATNTRVRDYVDIYTLTGRHDLTHVLMRSALQATAAFRGTTLGTLTSVIEELVMLRHSTYSAYRASLGAGGGYLPYEFKDIVAAVAEFVDHVTIPAPKGTFWLAASRRWST